MRSGGFQVSWCGLVVSEYWEGRYQMVGCGQSGASYMCKLQPWVCTCACMHATHHSLQRSDIQAYGYDFSIIKHADVCVRQT